MASPSTPLRIGILGCANIARQFARDVRPSRQVRLVAAASRSADKAQAFCREFGIKNAHASYEALLADSSVQAIYIPLPNHLHHEWAVRAARAGKHVLCEKPLCLGLAEARAMFDAARRHGVMLLEAYPYWFQPQFGQMVELLQQGAIGEVREVQAAFGFTLRDPVNDIRARPDTGGGALLDVGSYTVSFIRTVMGSAPVRVRADARWHATGVDIATAGTLYYPGGRQAQFQCAMDTALHRQALVVGSHGVLSTEYPNHTATPGTPHPWGYQPSALRLRRGAGAGPFETLQSPAGSGFRFAAEAFARVVREGDQAAISRAAAASLDIAHTLQALAESARTGRAVAL